MAKTGKGSNAATIKQHNRAAILNAVAEGGSLSRTDIARTTGLSKGGISPIIGDLITLGLLRETGAAESNGGKKPIPLSINPKGWCSIAADWRRNVCRVARVDMAGDIEGLEETVFTDAETPATVIRFLIGAIRGLLPSSKRLTGICVVAPGPLDRKNGVILNPPNFRGWAGIPVVRELSRHFRCPAFLENVATAYGIAEKYLGIGKQYPDFVHIIADEGIGASVIINKQLYLGADGFGSELGHISVDMNGPVCSCGNTGCLELYASLPALLGRLESALGLGAASPFFAPGPRAKKPEWDDVLAGLEAGDGLCLNLMKKEAEYLGMAIVTAVNLFEPRAVILGSEFAKAGTYLLDPLQAFIKDKLFTRTTHGVPLFLSELENAPLSGGGFIVQERFINGGLGPYEEALYADMDTVRSGPCA